MNQYLAIIGSLLGDEGKARIAHQLAPQYDWMVRWGGGANAGHTIYRDKKKYVHHLLPSIDWRHPKTNGFLSAGMAIDPQELVKELEQAQQDFPNIGSRLYLDPNATVVLPSHKQVDISTNTIGTTNKGIGPAYQDKYARKGARIVDFMSGASETARSIGDLKSLGVQFKHVYELLPKFHQESVLFEGAQGVLLDINHGTYPYVTCSDTTLSGIGQAGFSSLINKIRTIGISKAYLTRVGQGPFPTQLKDAEAENLRTLGDEFGSTTGRARDVGWLDLPALAYACDISAIQEVIISKMDVLNGFKTVKVCHAYEKPITSATSLFNAVTKYTELPGWKSSDDQNLWDFLSFVNNYLVEHTLMKTKVVAFSVGVEDKDLIWM